MLGPQVVRHVPWHNLGAANGAPDPAVACTWLCGMRSLALVGESGVMGILDQVS